MGKPSDSAAGGRKHKSKPRSRRARSLQPYNRQEEAILRQGERHLSDKFVLHKEIGRGGYSRVYSARTVKPNAPASAVQPENDDAMVAVKIVAMPKRKTRSTGQTVDPEEEERENEDLKVALDILDNEISVMRKIVNQLPQHRDKFVQLYDVVYEENKRLCIVMELLAGQDMFDRIVARAHYSERDAAGLFESIVKTVQALHSIGIIHRDLKPENFVFASPDETSQLKLTDFGLAWDMGKDDPNAKVKLVGSPGYVAPEVLTSAHYSPAGDVWSMGVILYVLLSGYPPFRAGSIDEQMLRIVKGDYNFDGRNWRKVSKLGQHLVSKMLTVDVSRRITVEEILKHPWFLEAKLKSFGEDLQSTVRELRGLNDRRKITEAAMTVLSQAENNIRDGIWSLIENSPYANGFSQQDYEQLKKAVLEMKNEGTVSSERFVQVLSSLGFGELPLDEVFVLFDEDGDGVVDVDELIVGIPTVFLMESRENLLRFLFEIYDTRGQARPALEAAIDQAQQDAAVSDSESSDKQGMDPLHEHDSVLIDDKVDSFSEIENVTSSSRSGRSSGTRRGRRRRSRLRHQTSNAQSEGRRSSAAVTENNNGALKGITMNSLAVILRTLAGYERFQQREDSNSNQTAAEMFVTRRAALAAKISELAQQIVSPSTHGLTWNAIRSGKDSGRNSMESGESEVDQLLTFDQFKQNVSNFGDDLVQEYFFGPLEEASDRLGRAGVFHLDTLGSYLTQMIQFSKRTMRRWQQRYAVGKNRTISERMTQETSANTSSPPSQSDQQSEDQEEQQWNLPDLTQLQHRLPLNDSFQSLYTFRINTL